MKIHETWALYSPDFWVCGLAWYWRAAWAVLGPIGLLILERLLACLGTIERLQGVRRFQRAVRRALLVEIAIVGLVVTFTYARAFLSGWDALKRDDSELFEWIVRLMVLAAPVGGTVAFVRDSAVIAPPVRKRGRTSTWLVTAAVLALAYIGPPPVLFIYLVAWRPAWTNACLAEMMVMSSDLEDEPEPTPPGHIVGQLEFSAGAAEEALERRRAQSHVLEFARRHRTGEGRYPELGDIHYRPARSLLENIGSTDAALDELAAWAKDYPDPKVRDVAHDTLVDRLAARREREAEEAKKVREREVRTVGPGPSGSASAAPAPSGAPKDARP